MKKLISLTVNIILIVVIFYCATEIPEGPDAIEISTQGSFEKKPIKEYWYSDYIPLIPQLYGVRTFETTFGTPEQYTSQIVGTELIRYQTGDLLGTIVRFGNTDQIFYTEKKYLYWLKVDSKFILSTDCALTAYPSGCIYGEIYDGKVIEFIGPFYAVFEDHCEVISSNVSVAFVQIQDVKISGKRYNNALVLWMLQDNHPFIPLEFYGKDEEIGLRLPTAEQTNYTAIDHLNIFGFKSGLIAVADIGFTTGRLNSLSELVSISRK